MEKVKSLQPWCFGISIAHCRGAVPDCPWKDECLDALQEVRGCLGGVPSGEAGPS